MDCAGAKLFERSRKAPHEPRYASALAGFVFAVAEALDAEGGQRVARLLEMQTARLDDDEMFDDVG